MKHRDGLLMLLAVPLIIAGFVVGFILAPFLMAVVGACKDFMTFWNRMGREYQAEGKKP